MKQFLPLFFFSFLISTHLFSQNKIGQIAYAQWNTQEEKMVYYAFDNWIYDEEGREELFTHQDNRYSDYLPTNNTQSVSKYSSDGTLVEKNILYYGSSQWENILTKYKYNSDGRRTEEWNVATNSQIDEARIYKNIFEKGDIENRRTTKIYYKDIADDYYLRDQKDSIFNAQNCLVESSYYYYYENGVIQSGWNWKNEYTNDCQLLQSNSYRWEIDVDTFAHLDQHSYEYFNEGKLIIETYTRFDKNTNQWNTRHIVETELNDNGERVRYFAEIFRNNLIDSLLILNTYTSRNEVKTHLEFKTTNTPNGKLYQQVRNDSFSYHYNLDDQILLKEEFIQLYSNPVFKRTTSYDYYCNGQIKSEIRHSNFRKDYRYDGGVDCPLEEGEKAMIIFPNPTSGIITVQANLLANSEVTIQVFTILGQEVFSKKINQTSYQYQMDLSSLGRGHYFLSISNQNEKVTKKLVIF